MRRIDDQFTCDMSLMSILLNEKQTKKWTEPNINKCEHLDVSFAHRQLTTTGATAKVLAFPFLWNTAVSAFNCGY